MDPDIKEACRVFWLVKGHLKSTDATILSSYNGYFKRLWNNNERSGYGMEGFEEAYKKLMNTNNTYTQREWDRTVGWGVVPKEYKK